MYNVDSNVLAKYASDSREIFVRATFNNTHKVNGDYIKSFTIDDSVSGGNDNFSLGNACSAKLELEMYMPPSTGYTYTDAETGTTTTYNSFTGLAAAEIKLEVGVEVDGSVVFTPLGVFFVDSYESKNEFKSVKITAFDAMLKIDNALGGSYTCSLAAANPTVMAVLQDILTQAGISTAYIGNATSGGSSYAYYLQDTAGVKYSDSGVKSNSNTSIGVDTPFEVSKYATEIDFILQSDSDTFPSAIKVLYFSDASATNLLSVQDFEVDTDFIVDVGYGDEVQVQTTLPSHSTPIYVVFCADIANYSSTDLNLYIGINQNTPSVTNYINNTVTIPNPNTVDVSARTMLGYMAGIMGCNAKFDRNGHFVLKRIGGNTDINIERTEQYMDGFETQAQNWLTVGYVTTGSDTNGEGQGEVITVGNGTFGFNFENPYIPLTVNTTPTTVAQRILNLYSGLSFLSGNVKYRYNPSIDCGDTILVAGRAEGDYFRLVTLGHKISMTGGLSATVECNINTDTAKEFVSTPNSKKLTSKFNDFISKYQDIVKVLTSVSGGFVKEVRDSNEKVRALAITQSDIEVEWDETNNKVVVVHSYDSSVPMWVWSYGGLSFSNNGGATYEVAINMRGEIYANNLVSARGTIGAFTIDDASITYKGGLFTDYIPSGNGTAYRVFIQPAYVDSGNAAADTWVISTQKATVTNGSVGTYTGTFIVHANGDVDANGNVDVGGILKINRYIQDMSGYQVFGTNNNYVFGYGAYVNGLPTYLEGNNVYLRAASGNYAYFQQAGNTRLTFGRASFTLNGSTADRDFIESSGGFVLEANGGSNWLYLFASKIYSSSDTKINGNLECIDITCNKISASGTVKINYTASAACPVYMTTSGNLYPYTSSKRYKENIKYELDEDLNPEKLYELPIAQYNYKEEYADRSLAEGKQIGLIAEDVAEIYPNAVIKNGDGEVESWQSMIMLPAMLKLIQEQKVQLDEQAAEIDDLKARLSALEDIVNKLTKE